MSSDVSQPAASSRRRWHIASESAWVLTGQCAAVIGSVALVNATTRYLDPELYGQLSLGLVVAGLGTQLVLGGVAASIARHLSIATEKGELGAYRRDAARLFAAAALFVLALGTALLALLALLDEKRWLGLGVAAIVLSIAGGLTATLTGVQNAARRRASAALHSAADAWLKIMLAVVLLESLGASPTSVMIGCAASAALVALAQIVTLRRAFGPLEAATNGPSYLAPMMTFAWPFSTWGLFAWLQQASDRWALAALASPREVGLYAVLFQLGFAPLATLTTMSMTLLAPILYQRSGDATDHARNVGVHRVVWRVAGASVALTAIAFVVATLAHEPLFRILAASEFRQSSHLLPWMVLAGGLHAGGQMLALKLLSELKVARMAAAKIGSSVAGVAFNVAGAAFGGLLGVVLAQVAFSTIYLAWMVSLTVRLPVADVQARKPD